ncbi:MAG TPA: DUF3025 domain-containing protein [Burkholderiales bacterium]|jgi:hypothetical protein|nr:DUF3025 domain-containing protein [Burkholderiales bacterium]
MFTWPEWRAHPLAPPFAPLAGLLEELPAAHWPATEDWNTLARQRDLRNAHGLPLCFMPASSSKMAALDFERRILERGEIETRAQSWHDSFHACAWALFPRAKARINAMHLAAGAGAAPNGRDPLRDLLTLFDESGIVIACADDQLAQLLSGFQWQALFWDARERVNQAMDFVIFGHALYEHCHTLHDGVTGKGVVVPVTAEYFRLAPPQRLAHLDAALAQWLSALPQQARPRDLQPLPLKGIPGWAAENENPAYYQDERQFRPGRTRDRAGSPP